MDIGNRFDLSGDTAERVNGAKTRKNFECKAMGPGIDLLMSPPPRTFPNILLQPSLVVERGSSSGFSKAPWKL